MRRFVIVLTTYFLLVVQIHINPITYMPGATWSQVMFVRDMI